MNIWLVTVGEPLPVDEGPPRLLRAGLLARYLAQSGHAVTWWSSTFDHQRKRLRAPSLAESSLPDGTALILLHGRPYRTNVSLARMGNHRDIAREFGALASTRVVPDVILCSYPPVEICDEAVAYGAARQIPVVLDVRDLWPDAFLHLAPKWLWPMARVALQSLFSQSARACRGALALFAITDAFLDWGLARAGRSRNAWDATFPMAYSNEVPDSHSVRAAEAQWDRTGVKRDRPIACFIGTFGKQFDLESVVEAARVTRTTAPDLLWVLCGAGDRFERYRRLARGLENTVLPGWVERPAIHSLLRRAKVGIAPYRNTRDFVMSVPNKPIEYLSAGLPVVATIGGVLREKIVDPGAGISVPPGNPQALASAVVDLVRDKERHARMSEVARQLYRTEYVAEVVYRKMIAHLEEIAKEAARQRAGSS